MGCWCAMGCLIIYSLSTQALLELGKINQRAFVTCMAAQALHAKAHESERAAALKAMVALAKKHPQALIRVLPGTVETIVRFAFTFRFRISRNASVGSQ